jgi:hypothetical protein
MVPTLANISLVEEEDAQEKQMEKLTKTTKELMLGMITVTKVMDMAKKEICYSAQICFQSLKFYK